MALINIKAFLANKINSLQETISADKELLEFTKNSLIEKNSQKYKNLEAKLNRKIEKEQFKILTLEEYVDITVSQIELLRPDIIIHRIGADSSVEDLIVPEWTRKKLVVMNEIDKLLRKKDSYQGIHYSGQL